MTTKEQAEPSIRTTRHSHKNIAFDSDKHIDQRTPIIEAREDTGVILP